MTKLLEQVLKDANELPEEIRDELAQKWQRELNFKQGHWSEEQLASIRRGQADARAGRVTSEEDKAAIAGAVSCFMIIERTEEATRQLTNILYYIAVIDHSPLNVSGVLSRIEAIEEHISEIYQDTIYILSYFQESRHPSNKYE